MQSEKLKVVRGGGNVFRDLGHKNADTEQFKAILAAEIIKALDREGLSVRGGAQSHGNRGGRLLAHPQRRPRKVHRRSSYVHHQPARLAGGG